MGKEKSPIRQWNLSGSLVGEYQTIKEASEESGINRNGISACLIGRNYTSGGYRWSRGKECPPPYKRKKKKIDIFTTRGVYITSVEGEQSAATFCKVTQANVSQHLHGRLATCGGYILKENKGV